MTRYVQRRLEKKDRWAAAAASLAVATGVGVVTFYVTRLFLSRAALPALPEPVEGASPDAPDR